MVVRSPENEANFNEIPLLAGRLHNETLHVDASTRIAWHVTLFWSRFFNDRV